MILKLLLQPLVENAIIHGLEKKKKGGLLEISTAMKDGHLIVCISDNGSGMTAERLAFVRDKLAKIGQVFLREQIGESFEGLFGLSNVKARMQLYYGSEAELHIESEPGKGTKVVARIPERPGSVANGEEPT
ncbi:putative sensor-like histidine kinase [compost metagenome]